MAAVAEKLTNLIEPVVVGLGYELLGIEYISQGHHSVLRLYIDSKHGIEMDDCAKVSRQVSGVMDVEEPLKGQYSLEVSSPGLDRPLFKAEHYICQLGQMIRVRLRRPQDNSRKFRGLLVEADDESIVLRDVENGLETRLVYDNIDKANVVPEL